MSDVSRGSGWWEASDGKWYPPELHPSVRPDASADADRSGDAEAEAPSADGGRYLDPAIAQRYSEPLPAPDRIAGTLGLGAAVMLAGAAFLHWGEVTGPASGTVGGLTDSNGWGTIASGAAIAIGAALVLTGRRSGWVGAAMLLSSLAAFFFVAYSIADIVSVGEELPERLRSAGVPSSIANDTGVDIDIGLWLAAVGSGVALIASAVAFARRV